MSFHRKKDNGATIKNQNPSRRTAQPSRNQKSKPTTEALRHGEKPEKTSCTAETREETNYPITHSRNYSITKLNYPLTKFLLHRQADCRCMSY